MLTLLNGGDFCLHVLVHSKGVPVFGVEVLKSLSRPEAGHGDVGSSNRGQGSSKNLDLHFGVYCFWDNLEIDKLVSIQS